MDEVRLHPHAVARLTERGADAAEVIETVLTGERMPARLERIGFRRNFTFDGTWEGRLFRTKQVEAIAVREDDGWLVITVIVRFF